jgi:hypothetical protein
MKDIYLVRFALISHSSASHPSLVLIAHLSTELHNYFYPWMMHLPSLSDALASTLKPTKSSMPKKTGHS